jgi:hypothetical protein
LLPTNKSGILVLNPESNFGKTMNHSQIQIPNSNQTLLLNKISETNGLTIYRYKFGTEEHYES